MITLSSDFGAPYPAAMKGVILQQSDARLVDVSHDFPRQDVHSTAFWLREILPYFPPAVHLVVVDPGVGTARAAIVVRAGEHALVGPDNGVLLPAARELAGDEEVDVFEITAGEPESSTFHGRDVFAPAAAEVHEAGVDSVGEQAGFESIDSYEDLTFPEPTLTTDPVRGEVLVVDGFGNAITNLPGSLLADSFGGFATVNRSKVRVEETYAAVDPGDRLLTVGSHGNVELAANRERGDEAFGVGPGSVVEFST